MRIGIVCPYSWDIPGGVQAHVRDLAEQLLELGHTVSVLAPGDDDTPDLPPYVVTAGRAVPIQTSASSYSPSCRRATRASIASAPGC